MPLSYVWIDMTVAALFACIIIANFLCLMYGVFHGSFPATRHYLYQWLRRGYRWSLPILSISVIAATYLHYEMGIFFSLMFVLAITSLVGIMAWAEAPIEVSV